MFWILIAQVWAAPCCSGSGSQELILTGDERTRISVSGGQTVDSAEVRTTRMSVGAVTLLSDRWQASLSLPYVFQVYSWNPSVASGVGDIALGINWEALPEYSYSAWKPKGFLSTGIKFPTGFYDLAGYRLGLGSLALSISGLLIKSWGIFDTSLAGDAEWQSGPWRASSTFSVGFSPVASLHLGAFIRRALYWEIGGSGSIAFSDWSLTVSAKEALGTERVLAFSIARTWGR